jgi:hypothetical protein
MYLVLLKAEVFMWLTGNVKTLEDHLQEREIKEHGSSNGTVFLWL